MVESGKHIWENILSRIVNLNTSNASPSKYFEESLLICKLSSKVSLIQMIISGGTLKREKVKSQGLL